MMRALYNSCSLYGLNLTCPLAKGSVMTLQAGAHQSDGTGGAAASNRALATPSIPGNHHKHDCWVDKASPGPTRWEAMPLHQPGEAEFDLCSKKLYWLCITPSPRLDLH